MASNALTTSVIVGVVGGVAAGVGATIAAAALATPIGLLGGLAVAGGAAATVTVTHLVDDLGCGKLNGYIGSGLLGLAKLIGTVFLAAGVGGFALAAVLGFPITLGIAAIAGGSAALGLFLMILACGIADSCSRSGAAHSRAPGA